MKIGVIGGSGIYNLEAVQHPQWIEVQTPYGRPSDQFLRGTVGRHEVHFLPRHGRGHVLLPTEVNHRANIYGFKSHGRWNALSRCRACRQPARRIASPRYCPAEPVF